MTKARDLGSLLGASSQIDNTKITLDANEIPALDTSKITTGTFADARISQSSVSQHATSFDDNKIVNDISTLALRQASDQNKSAYNTNSQFVDVFQDATGIDTTTNVQRNAAEFCSSVVADSDIVFVMDGGENGTNNSNEHYNLVSGSPVLRDGVYDNGNSGNAGIVSSDYYFGSRSYYYDNTVEAQKYYHSYNPSADWNFGTGDFSIDGFFKYSTGSHEQTLMGVGTGNTAGDFFLRANEWNVDQLVLNVYSGGHFNIPNTSLAPNTWTHVCVARKNGSMKCFINGVSQTLTTSTDWSTRQIGNSSSSLYWGHGLWSPTGLQGYMDGWRISKGNAKFFDNNFTPPTSQPVAVSVNATGNFTGTTITASSSVSSMGAIITYQDNAGTNALNTDIVLELSADNGSNWSTATLSALPNFATGIKMAKVNDLAVTAGTQLKYRINFANQASGSKEARIRGVALQY